MNEHNTPDIPSEAGDPVPKKKFKERVNSMLAKHGLPVLVISLVMCLFGIVLLPSVSQLMDENEDLQSQLTELDGKYEKLKSDYDELVNGKDRILADANLAFEQEDWDKVIELTDQLHEDYYNTDQDKQGQELKKQAQAKIDEAEAAKKKKEEEEARKKAEEEAKGYETGITFDQLARNPDDYYGKKVKFNGKVIQVLDDPDLTQMRLAVDGDYDHVLLLTVDSDLLKPKVLEDDWITIYGVSWGDYTYTSTMNAAITVPLVNVDKIDR